MTSPPGERGPRVVAQAHRRRGLDELRTFGPDIELASRERVPGALMGLITEAGLEPAPGEKTRIYCQGGRRCGQYPHTSGLSGSSGNDPLPKARSPYRVIRLRCRSPG